jgi:adenylosuccinate lyase
MWNGTRCRTSCGWRASPRTAPLATSLGKADAHALVQTVASRASGEKRPFADLLVENDEIARVLSRDELNRLLDPEEHLGSALAFVEAALAAHQSSSRKRHV